VQPAPLPTWAWTTSVLVSSVSAAPEAEACFSAPAAMARSRCRRSLMARCGLHGKLCAAEMVASIAVGDFDEVALFQAVNVLQSG